VPPIQFCERRNSPVLAGAARAVQQQAVCVAQQSTHRPTDRVAQIVLNESKRAQVVGHLLYVSGVTHGSPASSSNVSVACVPSICEVCLPRAKW